MKLLVSIIQQFSLDHCCLSERFPCIFSLFACWFQSGFISQPTVFSSHNKPAPVRLISSETNQRIESLWFEVAFIITGFPAAACCRAHLSRWPEITAMGLISWGLRNLTMESVMHDYRMPSCEEWGQQPHSHKARRSICFMPKIYAIYSFLKQERFTSA